MRRPPRALALEVDVVRERRTSTSVRIHHRLGYRGRRRREGEHFEAIGGVPLVAVFDRLLASERQPEGLGRAR